MFRMIIKLTYLEARWWGENESRHGQGVLFQCPHCLNEYIGVAFRNPLDGGLSAVDCKFYWNRLGETLDNLTLEPSIDASKVKIKEGHWHGYVRNGTIVGGDCTAIIKKLTTF